MPVMEMLRGEGGREGTAKGVSPQEHLLGPGTYGAFIPPCGGTSVFLTFCHPLLCEGAVTGSGDSCCLWAASLGDATKDSIPIPCLNHVPHQSGGHSEPGGVVDTLGLVTRGQGS